MQAKSTTHEHLLSVVATEAARFPKGSTVRVLDAGCGRGDLMTFLDAHLPRLRPELRFEVRGFEVTDHGRPNDRRLRSDIDCVSVRDPWPYPDESCDVVISNQVLEHVGDPPHFFRELHRVLRTGGFSAHLFPLKHCFWEGHLHLPLAHRIRNRDLLRAYIRLASCLGLGRFPDHSRALGTTLDAFAEQHADFMIFFTRYLSYRQALELAQAHHLRGSFRYTGEYYGRVIRKKLFRRAPPLGYNPRRSALADWLAVMFWRHAIGVTLFLEKINTYEHGTEERVAAALAGAARGAT
jgi:SAM-dependent methyltransferase